MHSCPAAIYGAEANDILAGGASRDWIHGGPGNDRIEGWSERDFLWGDEGDDIITGGLDDGVGLDDRDIIWGGPGDDNLFGEQGEDTIYGGSYNRTSGQPIVYEGDDDWIFPDLYDPENPPVIPGQEIDLVTDIDDVLYHTEQNYGIPGVIEPWPGSLDNREENGFYGGRDIKVTDALVDNLMQIYVNDPFHDDDEKKLTGKDIVLNWEGDEQAINVYLDPQKTTQIHPGYSWTITDPWQPVSIYLEAVNHAGTGVVQTTITLTLDPDPGAERPLSDFMFLTVIDNVE